MALTTIPNIITSADTSNTSVVIVDNLKSESRDITVTVITGTFRFNTAGDASDSSKMYTSADGARVFTLYRSRTLSYKAANASETFLIE